MESHKGRLLNVLFCVAKIRVRQFSGSVGPPERALLKHEPPAGSASTSL